MTDQLTNNRRHKRRSNTTKTIYLVNPSANGTKSSFPTTFEALGKLWTEPPKLTMAKTRGPRRKKQRKSSKSQSPYHLFDIPPELRLKIYGFLMGGQESDMRLEAVNIDGEPGEPIEPCRRTAQLLRTNSIIYREALPILYGSHCFKAQDFFELASAICSFGWRAQQHIKCVRLLHAARENC